MGVRCAPAVGYYASGVDALLVEFFSDECRINATSTVIYMRRYYIYS
jgi:hypothetical protein